MTQDLSREELNELFTYDWRTGALCWRTQSKGKRAGKVCGHLKPRCGRIVFVNGYFHQCRRIAWIIARGNIAPGAKIITVNFDGDNLSINNLREVMKSSHRPSERQPEAPSTGLPGIPEDIKRLIPRTRPEGLFSDGGHSVSETEFRNRLERATSLHGIDIERSGGGSWSSAAYHAPVAQFEATA